MPRLSPARAAARRQQIIDAALICFAERGFHKATLRDVVRASGLSPGSIYSHFASKEEIVYAVVDARHQRDLRNLERAANADTLDQALRLLAEAFFPASDREEDRAWRRLAVQLWAESNHDRTLLSLVREGFDTPRRKLTQLLRRAKRRGDLAQEVEPGITARVLIAAFQGVTLQQTWGESMDPSSAVRVIRRLLPRR
jgi:AcrR family transcriptional regulator